MHQSTNPSLLLSAVGAGRDGGASASARLFRRTATACLAGSLALLTTGCIEDKKAKTQIEELEREVRDREENNTRLEARIADMRAETQQLRDKLHQAERGAGQASTEARNLARELERTRRNHESDLDRARRAAPGLNMAEMKTKFTGLIPAIATITGDASSGRGTIVRDDEKTWLYCEPGVIGGNTKLTVTLSSGESLTKFGQFQIAGDSPLVRLEILEEVPQAFELDGQRPIDESMRLLTVSFTADAGEPRVIEGSALETAEDGFEINIYGTKSSGDPVVSADNAKLVAILVDSNPAELFATDVQREGFHSQRPRALTVNRPIDWVTLNISAFIADHSKIKQMNQTTLLLNALAQISYTDSNFVIGSTVPGSNLSAQEVFSKNASHPSVADLAKLQEDLAAARVRIAERDIVRRIQGVVSGAVNTARREVIELNAAKMSPFHKTHAEQALAARQEADQAVTGMMQSLAN